jgi:predicted DNA-binding WGR domain protein
MTQPTQSSYLERHDAARNMARFYAIDFERDLFGSFMTVRRWGRIGTTGRQISASYPSETLAANEISQLLMRKMKRGYRPPQTSSPLPLPAVFA